MTCFPAHLSAFGQFIIVLHVLHPAHHSVQNKTMILNRMQPDKYLGNSGFLLDLHLILAKFYYCFYEKRYCLVSHRTRYQHTPEQTVRALDCLVSVYIIFNRANNRCRDWNSSFSASEGFVIVFKPKYDICVVFCTLSLNSCTTLTGSMWNRKANSVRFLTSFHIFCVPRMHHHIRTEALSECVWKRNVVPHLCAGWYRHHLQLWSISVVATSALPSRKAAHIWVPCFNWNRVVWLLSKGLSH